MVNKQNLKLKIVSICILIFAIATIVLVVIFKNRNENDEVKEIDNVTEQMLSIKNQDMNLDKDLGLEETSFVNTDELENSIEEIDSLLQGLNTNSDYSNPTDISWD